jgi:hypothetical protein
MTSAEFYQPTKRIRIMKASGAKDFERAIRLYCSQFNATWELQIRGPNGIGYAGMADGKDNLVANASLTKQELIALRDAIDAALADTI